MRFKLELVADTGKVEEVILSEGGYGVIIIHLISGFRTWAVN